MQNFTRNARKEIQNTLTLFRKRLCLTQDAQILIDSFGNVWHLDLDRCHMYQENIEKKFDKFEKECVPLMEKTLQMLVFPPKSSVRIIAGDDGGGGEE